MLTSHSSGTEIEIVESPLEIVLDSLIYALCFKYLVS